MATNNSRAPSSSTKKGAKTAQESCLICDKVIKDGVPGQESILCEGECCQGWIHRTCAGLSKRAFQIARESADPYLCHYCSSLTLQREIKQLKQTVSSLQAEVESFRSAGNSPEITAPPSPGINQDRATYASVTNTGQSNPTPNPSRVTSNTTTTHHDKKFNLVVYGIEESAKGSPRHVRSRNDMDAVADVLTSLDSMVHEHYIRDCQRLGKYLEMKHRPILVKLSRSCDVTSILSSRAKLAGRPGISIKPDMTKEERKIESILLQERRKLIQSGTTSSFIKLRGTSLYVNSKKVGSVRNFKYAPVRNEEATTEPQKPTTNDQ